MTSNSEPDDLLLLAGRCTFCGQELGPDQSVCPECGHATGGELLVQPPKPAWVRILVWVVLIMAALGGIAGLIHLVGLI